MAKNYYRKPIYKSVDCDYLKKLSPENKEYMKDFLNEFYCNGHTKKDSLHQQNLSPERYEEVRIDMFNDMNRSNNDITAILEIDQNNRLILGYDDNLTNTEPNLQTIGTTDMYEDLKIKSAAELIKEECNNLADEIESNFLEDLSDRIHKVALFAVKVFIVDKKERDRERRANNKAKKGVK
jgi:hypothetical protein